jgi:phage terminase large subunit GpA-like protein
MMTMHHRLLRARLAVDKDFSLWRPPPKLSLIQWSDQYRRIAAGTSASPGRWHTNAQPVAFGPMAAVFDHGTHTVTVMSATQLFKSELILCVAGYYIHQDPSPILLVQPTQGAAAAFSKERFAPTVAAMPVLRALIERSKAHDSESTLQHKRYPGGSLDFVGANSPSDLASRPKRIILEDEIDLYPVSAGDSGDPMKLAEERASTYHAVGRAKFVRTCSPTIKGFSRIEREYLASDQRKCFVSCFHCNHDQVLTWAHVRWDRDEQNNHLVETAAIACEECGAIWSERDRVAILNALEHAPDHGWRQTKPFACCGEIHVPSVWDDNGRSICPHCETPSPYNGHAGFHCSKLYSKRHRLPEIVKEFLAAKGDPELLKKWTNSALAELWEPQYSASFDPNSLMARTELYGPSDLPEAVRVITGFCDVQNDRLEVQFVGWGKDEEAWPFKYDIVYQNPALPSAWKELDSLIAEQFTTVTGRALRVSAFGIDWGGGFGDQVLSYCRARRGRRIFACKGFAGSKPIWPGKASRAKSNDIFFALGVDTGKDKIHAALKIDPPTDPGLPKPGFIHFPVAEGFGPEYFEQLNAERRQIRKRLGQDYVVWVKVRERNEALDTLVGNLAMRKSLPRNIQAGLEYSVRGPVQQPVVQQSDEPETGEASPQPSQAPARQSPTGQYYPDGTPFFAPPGQRGPRPATPWVNRSRFGWHDD